MLNIAFCDDDQVLLSRLLNEAKNIISKLNVCAKIYTFTDGNKLINSFQNYTPYYDIVFLDIDMPIIQGKEIARKLRLVDKNFQLIFITSYQDEALNVFQFDVSAFIPKDLIDEKLEEVLTRVLKKIEDQNVNFQVFEIEKKDYSVFEIKIPLNDIMYIECVNRDIYLHTQRETYMLKSNKYLELVEEYQQKGFVPIHRNCIVNIKYIFSIGDIDICLDNKEALPMSRRKKKQIVETFTHLVSEEFV